MGHRRAGSKRRKPDPINQAVNQPSNVSQEIPGRTKIVTGETNSIHSTNSASDRLINNIPFMPDVPLHLDLLLRNPKQQPIKQNIQEINPKINFDFEEKCTISRRCYVGDIPKMRQVIFSKTQKKPHK